MMNQTMVILGVVITIATVILTSAAYFFIKNMINDKIDKEVEMKVIKVLVENPPTLFAKGKETPNQNGKIIMSEDIKGIRDLEPNSLIKIEVMPERQTMNSMESGLISFLSINEDGEREINIPGYSENNGKISWYVNWMRKSYNS
jgi:hypothetical protein